MALLEGMAVRWRGMVGKRIQGVTWRCWRVATEPLVICVESMTRWGSDRSRPGDALGKRLHK